MRNFPVGKFFPNFPTVLVSVKAKDHFQIEVEDDLGNLAYDPSLFVKTK